MCDDKSGEKQEVEPQGILLSLVFLLFFNLVLTGVLALSTLKPQFSAFQKPPSFLQGVAHIDPKFDLVGHLGISNWCFLYFRAPTLN